MAFKLTLAKELDSIKVPVGATSGILPAGVEARANTIIKKIKGKEVLKQITFNDINEKGKINFQDSFQAKGKGKYMGKTMEFISISIQPSPQHLQQWKSLTSGYSVKCKAIIDFIMISTRWLSSGAFAGHSA